MATAITYNYNGREQSLPLVSTTLKSHVVDLTASHTLTQAFINPLADPISEAQYTFPLYESCAVTDFQALVGEKIIRGVVKEKDQARAEYEAAKADGEVAALFDQKTAEIFTTSVGNIPARDTVFVVIKYVHELKQDIGVEAIRLVIPTVIFPKYGDGGTFTGLRFATGRRTGWDIFSRQIPDIGREDAEGVSIAITTTMSGPITGITSPSHPISVGLGSHPVTGDPEHDPKKAHATLNASSLSVDSWNKDFTLLINADNIGGPRAFLAPHPTLRDTSTLMVTIVPKFVLPPQHHEIIFIADCSVSMSDKISTVRSALRVFLASLPVGSFFNICSFGSSYSFLWSESQEYSEETLTAAKDRVDTLRPDMGGTEILAPVCATIKRRRPYLMTEVLVLTDGEVWNPDGLYRFINETSKDGNVRFFSLGVGDTVSHALVEGISRAGKGYSQIVNTTSSLRKKVMRMLKAALTPHGNDWCISWEGKPKEQRATLNPTFRAPITLFDPNCDPDVTIAPVGDHIFNITAPKVIQAPTNIPPLFPYSRTSVYFLISNGDKPKRVFLDGTVHDTTTNSICPLQIEIPVQSITASEASSCFYQLAGRKILQDLEEGRVSYLEGVFDEKKEPTKYAALVEQEGTRVGVKFGLASKWTSFVAVEEDITVVTREGIGSVAGVDDTVQEVGDDIVEKDDTLTQKRGAPVAREDDIAPVREETTPATEEDDTESEMGDDIFLVEKYDTMTQKRGAPPVEEDDTEPEMEDDIFSVEKYDTMTQKRGAPVVEEDDIPLTEQDDIIPHERAAAAPLAQCQITQHQIPSRRPQRQQQQLPAQHVQAPVRTQDVSPSAYSPALAKSSPSSLLNRLASLKFAPGLLSFAPSPQYTSSSPSRATSAHKASQSAPKYMPQCFEAPRAEESAPRIYKTLETEESAPRIYKMLETEESAPRIYKMLEAEESAPQTCEMLEAEESAPQCFEAPYSPPVARESVLRCFSEPTCSSPAVSQKTRQYTYGSPRPTSHSASQSPRSTTTVEPSENILSGLSNSQQFSGLFRPSPGLWKLLNVEEHGLAQMTGVDQGLLVTVVAILVLERRFKEMGEEWELMVQKARMAIGNFENGEAERVMGIVEGFLA